MTIIEQIKLKKMRASFYPIINLIFKRKGHGHAVKKFLTSSKRKAIESIN
ncbi:hypothetical protein ADIARSV_0669 [Arcticibacter svalbardensis MN12-7]|uniref:Uncharacterized protein n=1 Tax=Arcticibacter svalbardensis MN12-7 TaxID=1150600 RepID=R9GWP9_9SPHI|nr:hypothetical protein ADIARSV_0669 [Arcticibacter svalbardensis MN12-7]